MMGREGKEQSFVTHLLCAKGSDALKIFFLNWSIVALLCCVCNVKQSESAVLCVFSH